MQKCDFWTRDIVVKNAAQSHGNIFHPGKFENIHCYILPCLVSLRRPLASPPFIFKAWIRVFPKQIENLHYTVGEFFYSISGAIRTVHRHLDILPDYIDLIRTGSTATVVGIREKSMKHLASSLHYCVVTNTASHHYYAYWHSYCARS